jgi:hypothetical protein
MLIILVFFIIIHIGFEPIFGAIYENANLDVNLQFVGVIFFVAGAVIALTFAVLAFVSKCVAPMRRGFIPKYAVIVSLTPTAFILLGIIYLVGIIFGYFKSIRNRNPVYIEYYFVTNYANNVCPDGKDVDCINGLDMDLYESLKKTFWIEDIYKGGVG